VLPLLGAAGGCSGGAGSLAVNWLWNDEGEQNPVTPSHVKE
jgi:hypothetical protein